jgi:hypothetical protein
LKISKNQKIKKSKKSKIQKIQKISKNFKNKKTRFFLETKKIAKKKKIFRKKKNGKKKSVRIPVSADAKLKKKFSEKSFCRNLPSTMVRDPLLTFSDRKMEQKQVLKNVRSFLRTHNF